MAYEKEPQRLEEESQTPAHPVSFVLRCWVSKGGVVRSRLTDVRSGMSYPLADLAGLPALVQRLVLETSSSLPTDTEPT